MASFAGDLDEHRSRLTPLVRRHDRLRLRRLAFSKQELEQVRAEITAGGLDDVKQVGIGDGAVDVGLAARAEVLAAEWHLRYGSALRIHVGNLPYPPTAARPPVDIPRSTTTLQGVELRVVFDPPEVASGEHIHGQLVLCNRSDKPAPIQSGQPLVGMVVRPATDEVLGCFSGAIAGTGWSAILAAGDQASLRVIVGTASCRVEHGYVLPPGEYEAVVPLRLHGPEEGRVDIVVPPRVPITLRS